MLAFILQAIQICKQRLSFTCRDISTQILVLYLWHLTPIKLNYFQVSSSVSIDLIPSFMGVTSSETTIFLVTLVGVVCKMISNLVINFAGDFWLWLKILIT